MPVRLLARRTSLAPAAALVGLVLLGLTAPPVLAAPPAAAALRTDEQPASCRCERFAEEMAAAEALFENRGAGASWPLDSAAHQRFRQSVDAVYDRAGCLANCNTVPEVERNAARALFATAAFKTIGLPQAVVSERLAAGAAVAERCLAIEPARTTCLLWRASARGVLARSSWNPLNVRLPAELLDGFRAARGEAPPGEGLFDGASTRGETLVLLRAPRLVGGDPTAALHLIETAATSPRFRCTLSNRLLLAQTLARTGERARAIDELRATIEAGLPPCGRYQYENALAIEEARRCLRRLQDEPTVDPGWDNDCADVNTAVGSNDDKRG